MSQFADFFYVIFHVNDGVKCVSYVEKSCSSKIHCISVRFLSTSLSFLGVSKIGGGSRDLRRLIAIKGVFRHTILF